MYYVIPKQWYDPIATYDPQGGFGTLKEAIDDAVEVISADSEPCIWFIVDDAGTVLKQVVLDAVCVVEHNDITSLTDALAAIKKLLFENKRLQMAQEYEASKFVHVGTDDKTMQHIFGDGVDLSALPDDLRQSIAEDAEDSLYNMQWAHTADAMRVKYGSFAHENNSEDEWEEI